MHSSGQLEMHLVSGMPPSLISRESQEIVNVVNYL